MKKVCIIGAGAAGLIAARNIISSPSLECTVYEQGESIGGIWLYTEKVGVDHNGQLIHSSMYRDLRTNLPKEIMGSLDFPFHKGTASFVSHSEVLQYLHDYANHFQLWDHIQFNKRVTCVKPIFPEHGSQEVEENHSSQPNWNPKWHVAVQTSDQLISEFQFDSVFVCNGHYCKPWIPDIVNMNKFQGKVLHSRDYRTPEIFANKRVVVVGCGPSGVDISLEIAQVATKVIMSVKKLPLVAKFPDNVHQTFPIKSAKANSVIFENDEEIECDVLLICTGYEYDFPFLSGECGVNVEKGRFVTPLYRHMIHSKFPTLCFIGIPFQVCPFVLFDCQVRFYVKYLEGLIRLPSEEEMNSEIQKDKSLRKMMGLPFSRSHQLGEFQWQYFHTLAEEAEFLPKVMPVVRKIYDRVGKRRLQFPSIYRNDSVRIIDEENFQFTEFSSSNHSSSS